MHFSFLCFLILCCYGESTLSTERLEKGIVAVQSLLSLIYNRYEVTEIQGMHSLAIYHKTMS